MKARSGFRRFFLIAGGILILLSMALLIWHQASIRLAESRAEKDTQIIRQLIPEIVSAVPEMRTDNDMPVFSVNGTDYIGLLEYPEYNSVIPIQAEWTGQLQSPGRYKGSVYDRSMIVGLTNARGQYAFWKDISVNDVLYFTDMTGSCYRYEIAEIQYREHADDENLISDQSDLTVFVKNLYALNEYIILHCTTQK